MRVLNRPGSSLCQTFSIAHCTHAVEGFIWWLKAPADKARTALEEDISGTRMLGYAQSVINKWTDSS